MTPERLDIFNRLIRGCHGNLKLLILYGSSNGSDQDYLAIFDRLPRSSSLTAGALDLWAIAESSLVDYLGLLDPFVSEPLLTGRAVYGSEKLFTQYQARLVEQAASPEAIRHLLCRSMQLYVVACERLAQEDDDSPVLGREFWSGLSFSVSYWVYAKCYSERFQGPLSLKDVLAGSPAAIQALWREIQVRKVAGSQRSTDLIDRWAEIMIGLGGRAIII